jgi:hypothetical protein
MTAAHRFRADWVASWRQQDADVGLDPTYDSATFPTREAAEAAAIANGKKAGVIEWIGVREQRYDITTRDWETVERWTGDWSGLAP